jgi:hypothetical protein
MKRLARMVVWGLISGALCWSPMGKAEDRQSYRRVRPAAYSRQGDAVRAKKQREERKRLRLRKLRQALNEEVSLEFEDIHFQKVAKLFSQHYGLKIMVDQQVCAAPAVPAAPGKATESASKKSCTIRYLNVQEATLREALNLMCRQTGLDYTLRPGYIWVTTYEKLAAENLKSEVETPLVTRSYRLKQVGAETIENKIVVMSPGVRGF